MAAYHRKTRCPRPGWRPCPRPSESPPGGRRSRSRRHRRQDWIRPCSARGPERAGRPRTEAPAARRSTRRRPCCRRGVRTRWTFSPEGKVPIYLSANLGTRMKIEKRGTVCRAVRPIKVDTVAEFSIFIIVFEVEE